MNLNSFPKSHIPRADSPCEGLDVPGLGLDLVEVEDLDVVLLGPGREQLEGHLELAVPVGSLALSAHGALLGQLDLGHLLTVSHLALPRDVHDVVGSL